MTAPAPWQQDLLANANRAGVKGAIIGWFMNPGFAVATLYRWMRWGHLRGGALGRLVAAASGRAIVKGYGCYIMPSAAIGPAPRFPHPVGIVVGEGTRIGANVTIYQHVTFGRRSANDASYPVVSDDVIIYAGATLVGGIHIGAGAVIGAHALVLGDVPAGGRVFAAPASVLPPRTD